MSTNEKQIEIKVENDDEEEENTKFKDMSTKQKTLFILSAILRPIGILICLYFFVCSLDFMSTSFKLIAG